MFQAQATEAPAELTDMGIPAACSRRSRSKPTAGGLSGPTKSSMALKVLGTS